MTTVRRRRVFYVSGFDPKGASHYHALYKEQSALQAQWGGIEVQVGARKRLPNGNSSWDVHAVEDGQQVHTRYEFMRWDDLVRANWPRSQWVLWRDMLATTAFYLRHGALQAMARLSWPPALAVALPPLMLVMCALGLPALTGLAAWLAARAGGPWAAAAAGAAAAALLLWGAHRLESRFSMYWLMRSYAFTARQAMGQRPELEQRLDEQAGVLARQLQAEDVHEVLVVGHSSGANMAASIVARALRQLQAASAPRGPASLSLLTLGQWIPLLGLLPQAQAFRGELAVLATAERLDWLDFSAPPDGCCFALCDPVAGSGVRVAPPRRDRPKLLSPRFARMFEPRDYEALRRDKLRLHFQYLMAGPLPCGYDFFRITAGIHLLATRYAMAPGVTGYAALRLTGRVANPRAPA